MFQVLPWDIDSKHWVSDLAETAKPEGIDLSAPDSTGGPTPPKAVTLGTLGHLKAAFFAPTPSNFAIPNQEASDLWVARWMRVIVAISALVFVATMTCHFFAFVGTVADYTMQRVKQSDVEALSRREIPASAVKGVSGQKASAVSASKLEEVKPSPASVFDWHLLLIGSELIIPPTLLLFALMKRVFERAPGKEKDKSDDDSETPAAEGIGEAIKGVGEVLKELIAKK